MMKLAKVLQRETLYRLFFWIGFSIEMFLIFLSLGAYNLPYERQFFQIAMLFFFGAILFNRYTKREKLFVIIVIIVSIISLRFSVDNLFAQTAFMILAAKNISTKVAIKFLYCTMLLGTVIYFILSAFGVLGVFLRREDYGRGSIENRYCFGQNHPNFFHATIWILLLLTVYLFFENLKIYHIILLGVFNVVIYLFTLSRTGIIIGFFILFLTSFFKYCTILRDKKWIYYSGIVIQVMCIIFCYITVVSGTSLKLMQTLNEKLTGRIFLAHQLTEGKSLYLFQRNSEWINSDIGYISMLYCFGILFSVSYLAIILFLIRYCFLNKKYVEYVIILTLMIIATVEIYTVMMYIGRNIWCLLLFGIWSSLLMKKKHLEINHEIE